MRSTATIDEQWERERESSEMTPKFPDSHNDDDDDILTIVKWCTKNREIRCKVCFGFCSHTIIILNISI